VIANEHNGGALSLEDDFYLLHQPKKDYYYFALYHLNAKGGIRALTEYGRRPEQSPFDAENHWPQKIGRSGKKLFVVGERDYFGEFDPTDQSWKMQKANSDYYFDITHKDEATRSFGEVEAIKRIAGPNAKDAWSIDYQSILPGMLVCSHPKLGKRQIPIDIKIPDNFVNQVKYASVDQSTFLTQILPHSEHIKKLPLYITVVNQTRDDLILALRFAPRYSPLNHLLPFLWKLPKNDLLKLLDAESNPSSAK
jgi:hypothetical protein